MYTLHTLFFPAELYQYPSVYIAFPFCAFWLGCNTYDGCPMALVMVLGAFYLVIRATLDDLVCLAHNRDPSPHPLLFPIVFPLMFCILPHELCTKVHVPPSRRLVLRVL